MFKRLAWMTVGFSLAVWSRRVVRARIERYRPSQVSVRLTRSMHRAGERVRAAADEGLRAMREREEQLRRGHLPTGGHQPHR
ncbi:MAG: hypothetical protein KY447_04285 [Actinobacteria bacterium]|nr:hypothetical protein [Actinomycetota bacterium]MBW3642113.1 hypothetical protein [Actinomycetota bacterium]